MLTKLNNINNGTQTDIKTLLNFINLNFLPKITVHNSFEICAQIDPTTKWNRTVFTKHSNMPKASIPTAADIIRCLNKSPSLPQSAFLVCKILQ